MIKFIHFLILILGLTGCNDVRQLQMFLAQKKVSKNFADKNISGAQEISVKSLAVQPNSQESLMNLGLSFELQKKNIEALSTYSAVEKNTKSDEYKFYSHFNRGQLQGQLSKIDEALEQYQLALKYNPTSIEVKTNIELLIKKQQQQQQQQDSEKKDEGGEGNDQKEQKDQKEQDEKENEQKKDPQQVKQSAKYKPRPFNGEQLSEDQVKKILGELKRQEQKIRDQYQNQEVKELPRAKDW